MTVKGVEPVDVIPFNTNNAWGFGGGIGKVFVYSNGYTIRKGRAYFRHLPPRSFVRYFDADHKEISKKEFERAI